MSQEALRSRYMFLDFRGLDTVATVTWNGEEVAKSDNMFVRYIAPVVPEETNDLRVQFASPIQYSEEKYYQHIRDKGYDVKPKCQFAECHANHIRKMQSSFG